MFRLEDLLQVASNQTGITNVNALSCGTHIVNTPYKIQKLLSRGDVTFTYLALNTANDESVVIKEFFPMSDFIYETKQMALKRISDGTVELKTPDQSSLELFQTLKGIFRADADELIKTSYDSHVVTVLETFEANNTSYMVLEHLPYPTLKALLKNKLLKPRQALGIFSRLLQSVKLLHDQGFVHTSLKPSNIYVTENQIILGDYRVYRGDECIKLNHESLYHDVFTAPEVIAKQAVGRTSDVYSLGKILEFLMEHIGYRSGNLNRVDMGDDFDAKKIDSFLRGASRLEPEQRLQSINDMIELMNSKHAVKPVSKTFYVVLLAAICVLILAFALNKLEVFEVFSIESETEEETGKEIFLQDERTPFRMITNKVNYDFDENIVFVWTDTENDHYSIILEINDGGFSTEPFMVDHKFVNIKGLSLNPGYYSLIIKKSSLETIQHDFRINASHDMSQDNQPIFEYENYGYYTSEDMSISWTSESDTHIRIYDLNHQELLHDYVTASKTLDLNQLNMGVGDYIISAQTVTDDGCTPYDHTRVKVLEDEEAKPLVVLINNNDNLSSDDVIEWLPVAGEVHFKITNINTGTIVKDVCASGESAVDLSVYDLVKGDYELRMRQLDNNLFSDVIMKQFHIVAK